MVLKKTLTYVRYSLVAVLILYLGIVWLYFKDNASSLTISSFVLWFLGLPLLFLGALGALRWYQNKPAVEQNAPLDAPNTTVKADKAPISHHLLLSGHLLLPEGNTWSQIIDNAEDLTEINRSLTDYFGLPKLTKPIAEVEDQMIWSTNEDSEMPESTMSAFTQRITALLQLQLETHDEALATIGAHFSHHYTDRDAIDTASDIHPEWQNGATLHMQQEDVAHAPAQPELSVFELYIYVPNNAELTDIKESVTVWMEDYGIAGEQLSIHLITPQDAIGAPLAFINDVLRRVAETTQPQLGMLIVADTHIDQEWLDSYADINTTDDTVPTEAASALLFANHAAGDIISLEQLLPVQLSTTIDLSKGDNRAGVPKRSYKQLLPQIQSTLLAQKIIPPAADETKDALDIETEEQPLVLLSDIDLVQQTEALTPFMHFTDDLSQQNIDVTTHHLGHLALANPWLRCFMPICLLTQYQYEYLERTDTLLAVIQHPSCCSLWHLHRH